MAVDFGRISTYQAGQWMSALAAQPLWFALAASDPNIGDPLAAEIIGGSYVRPAADFALATVTVLEQLAAVKFTGIAPGTVIAAVMVMDSRFGGNMISSYVLAAPVTLVDGGSWSFGAGDYVMGLDVSTI